MASNAKRLPKTENLEELVEFFDSHDMGDYLEDLPQVPFEINIAKRTHLVGVDDDLFQTVLKLARSKKISAEALINSLLREKLVEVAS